MLYSKEKKGVAEKKSNTRRSVTALQGGPQEGVANKWEGRRCPLFRPDYFLGKSWYFGGFGCRKECPKVHTNLDIDFTLIVMAPCFRREIACLPAMMKEGNCAIVISPAVSLTEDQVKAPKKKNERIYLVFSQRDKEEEMGVLDTSQCTLLILMLMSVLIFGLPHASSL